MANRITVKHLNAVSLSTTLVKMNDPYLDNTVTYNRLLSEYRQYGKIIVATDFDDTIYDYHKKGNTYTQVIDLLKECQALGFYICVFTGTPKAKYDDVHSYCKEIGLNIASINTNPFPMPFGNDGKMYYNILLDDRAGLRESYRTLRRLVDEIKGL